MKTKIKKILILAAWLVVWETAAMLIHNSILLAGPVEVGRTLAGLLQTPDFYRICLTSLGRIMLGMTAAFLLGCLCGGAMYRWHFFDDLISPLLSVMKSIPVASFVVLLLIWQGAANLSIWISFLVVFPNICINMKNGLQAVPDDKREMAEIFGIKGLKGFLYIYRPAVLPYLISCMEISIGMSFKSGVAAEVIGTPDYSIGERIYISKVYLDTAGLFSWTLSLIVISFLVEKVIIALLHRALLPINGFEKRGREGFESRNEGMPAGRKLREPVADDYKKEETTAPNVVLQINNASKSYGDNPVLSGIDKKLERGKRYFLMAPSGGGKTTLLRLIAGLEKPDEGKIIFSGKNTGSGKISFQFQEDRLLDGESTITNLAPYDLKRKKYWNVATQILPEESLKQQVSELSGGMKRRVSLIRALLYGYDDKDSICLLDEPFAGLDAKTKERVMDFIKKYQNGRTLLIATHDERDCERMNGTLWKL